MGLLFYNQDLNIFFTELLKDINCQDTTRAYLINLYTTFKDSTYDLSDQNIGLYFLQSKNTNNFANLQNIGDYIFFSQTMMPSYLQPQNYYQDIARLSYYACYKLINRQWILYMELADTLPTLQQQTIEKLHHLQIK